jgi:subtilase family serine protease
MPCCIYILKDRGASGKFALNGEPMFSFIWRRLRAILVFSATALLAATAWPAEMQVLRGHLPEVVARGLAPAGRLPASQQMRLAIGLPLRNRQGLTNLLRQLYDPASPLYHHYLTPEQFTAAYGPEEKDYLAVRRFAESHGLTVTGTSSSRMLLDVTGAVSDVEKAFHVHIGVYPHPTEARDFYSPDVEPSVDAGLAIADISGLNNYALPHPKNVRIAASSDAAGLTPHSGSGPSGMYIGYDFRDAYAPGVALTGSGQMLGLMEFDGLYMNDILEYESIAGLPAVPIQTNLLDGYNGAPSSGADSGNVEVSLDVELAIAMAPGLSKIVVFEAGPYGNQNDILNAMADNSQIAQLSCSWGWGGGPSATTDDIFLKMAAQGQSFFDAAGDSDAFTAGASSDNGVDNPSQANAPSSCPYICVVGGTTLSTTGPGGSWSSETVWNQSAASGEGGSGGISSYYPIPIWQTGVSMASNGGSTLYRNIPDVALTAYNIYVRYGNGTYGDYGGTSCAAPLWAGFTALVNQQNTRLGQPLAGFLNPALYEIGRGTNYAACFHDITTGNNTWSGSPNEFYAVPGYDLCTGWGTPAGSNLINALTAPAGILLLVPPLTFSASAVAGSPVDLTPESVVLTNLGTAALSWTLANPAPWLSASPAGGTIPTGGFATVNLTVNSNIASAMPVGAYTATIWFTNLTDGVAESFQFTLNLTGPQTQLVQNGTFGTGSFSSWTLTGAGGTTNYVGNANSVAVTTGSRHHTTTTDYGSYYLLTTNTYAALLGQAGGLAYLGQTLETVPGQPYLLSFWVANPGKAAAADGKSIAPNDFLVAWNGSTLFNQTNMAVFSYTNMQFVVWAANSSATLEFGARNDNDYFGLDDVSVTPIPPPVFQSAATAGGAIALTWGAMTGASYQLQYTTNLTPINWINLGTPITASNGVIAAFDTQPTDRQRFYRVVLAP